MSVGATSLEPVASLQLAPVDLLIFQGTPFCNIDCRYCYLPNRSDRSRLELETVRRACVQLKSSELVAANLAVLWHAGEPLVLPPVFYERAFDAIENVLGTAVEQRIQTNATLINDTWIKLFRERQVSIGVSLDGPAWLHDANRRTRSGKATSSRVLDSVRRLKDAGLPLNIICVLTAEHLARPQELFAFFEELGVNRLSFNIDEPGGPYLQSSHVDAVTKSSFREFLVHYFRLVKLHNSHQVVRELERGLQYVFARRVGPGTECVPIRNLTVGHDGGFSTLSPELHGLSHPLFGPFNLGNVYDKDPFGALAENSRLLAMMTSIEAGMHLCRGACGYFEICGGGLPANKLAEHATFEATETTACKFKRQAVADAVVEILTSTEPSAELRPMHS